MTTRCTALILFSSIALISGCGGDDGNGPVRTLSPTMAWVARYIGLAGAQEDEPKAIAIDREGNVIVTGYSGTSWPSSDCATVKYSPSGAELWAARYQGTGQGQNEARGVAVDESGNVYVACTIEVNKELNDFDYATIKYDTEGNEIWVVRYNEGEDSKDQAVALGIDGTGNIHVTGTSGKGIATIAYDSSGNELWTRRYEKTEESIHLFAKAMAVDSTGTTFVAADTDTGDVIIIGYDTVGNVRFETSITTTGGETTATALKLDTTGSLYLTGTSLGDYVTMKYSPDGELLWTARYDGSDHLADTARAMAVDAKGNVYVTGCTNISDVEHSVQTTIKYDSSGNQLWVRHYSGPNNPFNVATSLALDASGNIYVSGTTGNLAEQYKYSEFSTAKYDTNGNLLWAVHYNGPENFEGLDLDGATAMTIDTSGNVYVTGVSYAASTSFDFATIKYVQ